MAPRPAASYRGMIHGFRLIQGSVSYKLPTRVSILSFFTPRGEYSPAVLPRQCTTL